MQPPIFAFVGPFFFRLKFSIRGFVSKRQEYTKNDLRAGAPVCMRCSTVQCICGTQKKLQTSEHWTIQCKGLSYLVMSLKGEVLYCIGAIFRNLCSIPISISSLMSLDAEQVDTWKTSEHGTKQYQTLTVG